MNLSLTKRGDYVVRSALCLARAHPPGQHRKIRQVVAEMAVPQTFASQILADLVRAGLATSRAGRDGGYRLTRPAEEISLLEVIEAGEGPLRAERCTLGAGPCRWVQVCPLHETWSEAVDALRRVLAGTSLAQLVAEDRRIEDGAGQDGDGRDGASGPCAGHDGDADGKTADGKTADGQTADGHAARVFAGARRRSVAVRDTVQVEQAVADVAARCGDEGWLAARVVEAYAAAEALRGAVDPGGSPWAARTAPALRITRRRPGRGGTMANLGERPEFDIAWEVSLPGGATSQLQGTVTLQPLHPERTEIDVEGRFRLPARPAAEGELARRLARRTVRGFVRALAQGLEHGEPPRRATA